MKQYSKRIVKAMILLWFAGAVFGAAVIITELVATLSGVDSYSMAITVHLPELLAYIGAPVGGGILGYLLKSAFENREKIKQNPTYHENVDFSGGYDGE